MPTDAGGAPPPESEPRHSRLLAPILTHLQADLLQRNDPAAAMAYVRRIAAHRRLAAMLFDTAPGNRVPYLLVRRFGADAGPELRDLLQTLRPAAGEYLQPLLPAFDRWLTPPQP